MGVYGLGFRGLGFRGKWGLGLGLVGFRVQSLVPLPLGTLFRGSLKSKGSIKRSLILGTFQVFLKGIYKEVSYIRDFLGFLKGIYRGGYKGFFLKQGPFSGLKGFIRVSIRVLQWFSLGRSLNEALVQGPFFRRVPYYRWGVRQGPQVRELYTHVLGLTQELKQLLVDTISLQFCRFPIHTLFR